MATKQKTAAAKGSKAKDGDASGEALRASVGKAVKAAADKKAPKAKAEKVDVKAALATAILTGEMPSPKRKGKAKAATAPAPAVEVVDVTGEVIGAIEQQAKASKRKAPKAKAAPAFVEPVAVVEPVAAPEVVELVADEAEPVEKTAGDKAAAAVFAYAEKLGIDVGDVVRIAKSCEEYDMLVGLAGMEITDRVVWLAKQMARDFDSRVVRPHSPTSGLSRAAKPKAKAKAAASGEAGVSGKARATVFGYAATAVIRALRATCGMGFAQIRNVLDAMGAAAIADATIRAQMGRGGFRFGEPAPLTAEQIEQAKAASVAVAA